MNERIKQLKQQAIDYVDSVDSGLGIEHYRELVDLKFAELIVQECLNLVDRGGEFVSRPKLVERIKEHFGVEE